MALMNKHTKALCILMAGLLLGATTAQSIANPRVYEAGARNKASSNQAVGELFYQLQIMQEEMATLRGTVEELQNEVSRLKSQRLEDYKGLDKRIRGLSGATNLNAATLNTTTSNTTTSNTATPNTTNTNSSQSNAFQPSVTSSTGAGEIAGTVAATTGVASAASAPEAKVKPPVVKMDEKTQYRTAYGLVRAKKFKEAKLALKQYLSDYPAGRYTPNGMYWLAELHLVDKEYPQAMELFNGVASQYKSHRKTPDARFKVAKIHHDKGEKAQAKQMLTAIVSDYSPEKVSAAKLASNFLKKHYP